MIVKKNVHSSNKAFKQLEVNVDTVFYRFNEKKWEEDGEHLGWIYDEIWYEKDNYIEQVSNKNDELSEALMGLMNATFEKQLEYDVALMEITNLLMGGNI